MKKSRSKPALPAGTRAGEMVCFKDKTVVVDKDYFIRHAMDALQNENRAERRRQALKTIRGLAIEMGNLKVCSVPAIQALVLREIVALATTGIDESVEDAPLALAV
jgi:hypothetical protein